MSRADRFVVPLPEPDTRKRTFRRFAILARAKAFARALAADGLETYVLDCPTERQTKIVFRCRCVTPPAVARVPDDTVKAMWARMGGR